MNTSWADWVSLSVILLYLVPVAHWATTGSRLALQPLAGMIGTVALNEGVKHLCIGTRCPRPAGATNCNLCVNDGPQGGRPGMPSGHSAQVAFFVGYYLQQLDNTQYSRILAIGLVAYALLVFASRYAKECHTLPQIIVGALLGGGLSWLLVRCNGA